MAFLPFSDRFGIATLPENELWRALGLAFCGVGTFIRVAALWTLGKQFSSYVTLQTDRQLVQTGLYKYIRHPMYLSILILMPGMALVFRRWQVIPIAICSLLFMLVRMEREERLSRECFGDEFENYRQSVRRLVPDVY